MAAGSGADGCYYHARIRRLCRCCSSGPADGPCGSRAGGIVSRSFYFPLDGPTIDHLPLLVEPALGHVRPALQHHVVALQTARYVVPRRRDHGNLALQVLDDLVLGGELGCMLLGRQRAGTAAGRQRAAAVGRVRLEPAMQVRALLLDGIQVLLERLHRRTQLLVLVVGLAQLRVAAAAAAVRRARARSSSTRGAHGLPELLFGDERLDELLLLLLLVHLQAPEILAQRLELLLETLGDKHVGRLELLERVHGALVDGAQVGAQTQRLARLVGHLVLQLARCRPVALQLRGCLLQLALGLEQRGAAFRVCTAALERLQMGLGQRILFKDVVVVLARLLLLGLGHVQLGTQTVVLGAYIDVAAQQGVLRTQAVDLERVRSGRVVGVLQLVLEVERCGLGRGRAGGAAAAAAADALQQLLLKLKDARLVVLVLLLEGLELNMGCIDIAVQDRLLDAVVLDLLLEAGHHLTEPLNRDLLLRTALLEHVKLLERLLVLAQLVHGILQVGLDAALGLELLLVAIHRVGLFAQVVVGMLELLHLVLQLLDERSLAGQLCVFLREALLCDAVVLQLALLVADEVVLLADLLVQVANQLRLAGAVLLALEVQLLFFPLQIFLNDLVRDLQMLEACVGVGKPFAEAVVVGCESGQLGFGDEAGVECTRNIIQGRRVHGAILGKALALLVFALQDGHDLGLLGS
ncbi:hypothetical protein F503_07048 [Ophiostoma piceae UAMH 11346]|uniref:Uncharacterized protein n=1 Tax=Ophiostoma piceae (strain UAMH 11346) TaxID=1262450 RepID=S3C8W0_OPHP1|nr:hypothetical protein F503_07048 [Ophiostoma piceae UAMH 11346]